MSGEDRWLYAGVVGAPHGLDGSFHVVRPQGGLLELGATVRVGVHERTVTRRAGTDHRPILRLAGCEDREAAASLRGLELLFPRGRAPALEPDEWWVEDLEGCRVHDGGRELGVVRRVLALPSCEVLEVGEEGGVDELLVPLIGDAVREVDVDARRIEIDLRFLGG